MARRRTNAGALITIAAAFLLSAQVGSQVSAQETPPQPTPAPPASTPPPAPPPPPPATGSVTVGGGTVDGLADSSKAQEYREIPNGFFLQQLDFGVAKDAWMFDLSATDLLQEDQRVLLGIRKPGTLKVNLGYDQIPDWYSNTSATLFANAGSGRELFPVTIRQQTQSVAPPSGIGAILDTSLDAAQAFPDLRTRRDRAFGDLSWQTPVKGLTMTAGFSQEQRNGTHPQSLATNFSVGADITEFAGTTDFTSREASLGLDYAHSRFDVGGSVTWSQFHNDLTSAFGGNTYGDAYIVDNPLRAVDGTPSVPNPAAPNNLAGAQLFLSAPPDTTAAWVNVHAGVRIADWGRASVEFAVGHNKQDETFLPFTLNTAIVPVTPLVILKDGVAQSAYDGSIDLTRWDARVDGHPLKWFSFDVYAHDYKYDNKTPLYDIPNFVSTDVALANVAVEAEPFGYETKNYGGDLTFRPVHGLSLGAGVERETWDRSFRFTPTTNEDIYKASINWTPAAWGDIHLAYAHGKRRYDSYEEDIPADPAGLRVFDLADRDRDRYELLANFTPIDRLQIGVQAHSIDDDYPSTVFGRKHDEDDSWAIDFAVDAGAGVSVSGNYGEDKFRYKMDSRYRTGGDDPLDDWGTNSEDHTKDYGLGVTARFASGRVVLDVHGAVNDATGTQANTFAPGGQANGNGGLFPNITSKLSTYMAQATWNVRQHLGLAFAVTYENWDESNFQRDIMQPWMGATDPATSESVFLGARIPGYDFTWARVLLTYSF